MSLVKRGRRKKHVERDVLLIDDASFQLQEAYKTLRTNLQFLNADKNLKKIVITSCTPMEGKTTITANLAVSLAQAEFKVLVVDVDLRKPRLHKFFDSFSSPGLTNVLAQGLDFDSAKHHSDKYNFDFLTSGPVPPNSSELLASKRMEEFIRSIENRYDYILFDTPPTLFITDAAILSKCAHGVLMVCSSGDVTHEMFKKAMENFKNAGANVIGVVLNNVNMKNHGKNYYKGKYYYYHYYHYYDRNSKKTEDREIV